MFPAMKNSNIATNFQFSINFLKCKHCSRWESVTFLWDSVAVFVEYQLPVFVEYPTALLPSSDPVVKSVKVPDWSSLLQLEADNGLLAL